MGFVIEVIIFVVNVYLEQISYTYLSAKHICSMLDECEALSVYLVYFIRVGMVKQRVQSVSRIWRRDQTSEGLLQDGGMTTLQHGADVLASMFNAKQ